MLPLLALNAIVTMAASLGLWLFPSIISCSPQAILHITFALGIMPLILAAIIYFVPVLTRGSGATPWLNVTPVLAWFGAAGILAGFCGQFGLLVASQVSFIFSIAAVAAILIWMQRRSRRMLGNPHPCFDWYLAALLFLGTALLVIPAMAQWPAYWTALKLYHLHANLLGLVGLTAIGTLQVLYPTAAGYVDPAASSRLAKDLKYSCAGVLLLAIGAALAAGPAAGIFVAKPMALLGAALYLIAPLRMGNHWRKEIGIRTNCLNGAVPSLVLSCIGLLGLIFAGIGHMLGMLSGRDASLGFIVAFLLPLVSGAATQLLPVWLRPGPQRDWHAQLRNSLGKLSGLRALLMVCGGFSIALGWPEGLWLGVAGILLFATTAIAALLGSAAWPTMQNKP